MKKRKGMTVIEVVVAFVIMSFVGSMVAGVVTGTYALSAQLKKLPNTYYSAQGVLERDLKVLKEYAQANRDYNDEVQERIDAEKASGISIGESEGEKRALAALEEIKESEPYKALRDAGEANTIPYTLFGRQIDLYRLTRVVDDKAATFVILGGVSASGKAKRAMPLITDVTIKGCGTYSEGRQGGESEKDYTAEFGSDRVMYYRTGEPDSTDKNGKKVSKFLTHLKAYAPIDQGGNLSARKVGDTTPIATYNKKNFDYLVDEYYQWYISDGTKHTTPFAGHVPYDDMEGYNDILTTYPNGYTPIVGETKSSIKIKDDYVGKFIVLVVTPLSGSGATGQPFASNPIYISGLPGSLETQDQPKYALVVDASMEEVKYPNEDGEIEAEGLKGFEDGEKVNWIYKWTGGYQNKYSYTTTDKFPSYKDRFRNYGISMEKTKLNIKGESTSYPSDAGGGLSRFFQLKEASSSIKTNLPRDGKYDIFAVIKADAADKCYGTLNDADNKNKPYDLSLSIFDAARERELFGRIVSDKVSHKVVAISNYAENGSWRIVQIRLDSSANTLFFRNGRDYTDDIKIAEFIVVDRLNETGTDAVFDYLKKKYKMGEDKKDMLYNKPAATPTPPVTP